MTKSDEIADLEEDIKKNNKNLLIIIGIVVGLFVIFVLVGIFTSKEPAIGADGYPNSYQYNGFTFERPQAGALWRTLAFTANQSFDLSSYYSPLQLEDIPISNDSYIEIIDRSVIYLSFDPELQTDNTFAHAVVAGIEVGKVVGQKYGILNKVAPSALTQPLEGVDWPVATCDNVTDIVGVIIFERSNQTSVVNQDGCIRVGGPDGTQLKRAADRLMFQIVGIMR